MNKEKETKKQFLNEESLERGDNHQEYSQESKDIFKENKELIEEKLGEELKKMKVESKELKEEIKIEKKQIGNLEKSGKLARLLNIAQTQGPAVAVEIAKSMDDPYLLDALHDILVQKGFYKEFLK